MQKSQNEFLVSYRDHMGRVLKDMYMWKKKASETENHMRSHGEIGKLTSEVAKFKKAAVKFAQDSEVFRKEAEQLRESNTALREDKVYLAAASRRQKTVSV